MKKDKKKLIIIIGLIVLFCITGLALYMAFNGDYEERILENVDLYIDNMDAKYLEKINDDFEHVKNKEEIVNNLNKEVENKLLDAFDDFVDNNFKDLPTFEDEFRNINQLVEDIYNIKKSNDDGNIVRLINDKTKENILYVYGSGYSSLSKFYSAKSYAEIKNYSKAIEMLDEIKDDEILEQKVFEYKDEIVELIVQDIENNVDKMETEILENNNESQYKYVLSYLEDVKDDYSIDISNNESYRNLVDDINEKYNEYLSSSDVTYDVSKFKRISLEQLVERIKDKEETLVFLGRETCPYCVKFVPVLNESLSLLKIPLYYVDASTISYSGDTYKEFQNLATGYTNAYPTLVYFKNGKVVNGLVGYTEYNKLKSFYEKVGLD